MKPTPTLLAASSLLALLNPAAARAEDSVLSFELSTPAWADHDIPPAMALAAAPVDVSNQPLPIPARAAHPPMRFHSPQQLPAGVYRRGVAVALNEGNSATQLLPPAPPLPVPTVAIAPQVTPTKPAEKPPKASPAQVLDFALEPSPAVVLAQAKRTNPAPANPLPGLFEGESNSLVAWAVGSAEGTRTPTGGINPAFFGHTDPGNRVWNMGTFSYQHGAKTPEEADQKQLARLQNQGEVLRQRALSKGLNLTLEETLNGLDLANQSPLAAIGRVGYVERLAEAKANGHAGAEAILVARTRAYINPKTGRWNAPGLGNTEASIRRDQKRRADAVARAIAAYEAQNPDLQPQTWVLSPTPKSTDLVALDNPPTEPVDAILKMWTGPGEPEFPSVPLAEENLALEPDPTEDEALAGLWQVSIERFAQAARPQGAATSPQTASLGAMLFNRRATPDQLAADVGAAEEIDPNTGNTPPDPTSAVADPSPDSQSEKATPADSSGLRMPSWAETREGSQTAATPVPEDSAVSGAFPDSTVYIPDRRAAAAANPTFTADPIPQADSPAPPEDISPVPSAIDPVAVPLPSALETATLKTLPTALFPGLQTDPSSTGPAKTILPDPVAGKALGFEPESSHQLPPALSPGFSEPTAADPDEAVPSQPVLEIAPAPEPIEIP